MGAMEAGGGASGAGVGALGPLQALWREVYRKAGEAAEARTADLLRYHVYVYHPAAGPATTHTHYSTVQGLWRFSADPGAAPDPTYAATDSGSILDLEVLAVHRLTLEGYPL